MIVSSSFNGNPQSGKISICIICGFKNRHLEIKDGKDEVFKDWVIGSRTTFAM